MATRQVPVPVSVPVSVMLKDEVLNAVKNGMFNIFSVKCIEEGLELLSDVKAGEIGEDGKYPEGSIFYLADRKLQEFNKMLETAGQGA